MKQTKILVAQGMDVDEGARGVGEVGGDQAEVLLLFLGVEWVMQGNDIEKSTREDCLEEVLHTVREFEDVGVPWHLMDPPFFWMVDVLTWGLEKATSTSQGAMRPEAGSPLPLSSSSDKSVLIVVDIGKGLFRRAHLGSWSRTRTDLARLRVTPGHEGIERGREGGFCIQVISGCFALRLRSGGGMMMRSRIRRWDHQQQQAWSCSNCLWDQQENDL
ncbi:hypothetical protein F5148DRAFT_1153544 [Russula earlei]|uniref:Uncharacterized protein n=1 Tax=Russula earlei TaxID=71964 RepID=A0ACC0TVM7_9AGAM|nr:hypothetical protein F5148DRAFT_1153544 [Russula earlei]